MRAPMLRGLLPLLTFFVGCQCDPFGLETTRFVCTSQDDCAEGFECRDLGEGLGRECVRPGAVSDAGPVDAGDGDAGDVDGGFDGGSDAGFDAGADAGPDGGSDGGADGGVTALRFGNAPLRILTAVCSPVMTVETINNSGNVTAVDGGTVVTLSAGPPGVLFYAQPNCTGAPTNTLTIGAGLSSATFHAAGASARTYLLTASSVPLSPATQDLVVQNAPTFLAFTTTPPDPVRGGSCLLATVEARRMGTPTPVLNDSTIGLTVSPSDGARFYSAANCTNSTTTAAMVAGASTASFYVKPLTAGPNVISAAAPWFTATQTINTTPIVRRAQCSFPARSLLTDGGVVSALTRNCSISPALTSLSASLSMTQATTSLSSSALGSAEVRCRISSTTNLACTRRDDVDPVDVHYQVAEVPQGMLVQRRDASNCPASLTFTTPVTLSSSFVLKSVVNTTSTFDDEDMTVAALTTPTTLSLTPITCGGYDIQVVDWTGLTVTRGVVDGGLALGVNTVTVPVAAASTERALLLQPGTTYNGSREICSSMIRGAMPSGSSLVLTRGAGDPTCVLTAMENILYERIDFGAKAVVREYTASFVPGDASSPVIITPVDTTRTLVFSSSQIAGGQGGGESEHGGSSRFTDATFHLVLTSANTVTVIRGDSGSSALITFYVAELNP